MPLVRIDLPQSIDVFNVLAGDNLQIITAHDRDALRIDPTYLGINRSAAAFTLNIGRAVELKKQFYATLVDRLNAEADVRPQDVLIVLTEVAKENWSFGNSEAQYA